MSPIRILHIITGLNVGGAEMMLYKLLGEMDREGFISEVISLTNIGPVGRGIEKLGISVRALNMKPGIPDPIRMLRLVKLLKQTNDDVIQTWMYHADLIGGMAARMAGKTKIVWGIRQSDLDSIKSKKRTIWTVKACARISNWVPKYIICCSEASQQIHTTIGYAADKMLVIPNGFNIDIFKPSIEYRQEVRKELDIKQNAVLIGLIARFDPQKDHHTFIEGARSLLSDYPDPHFLLCGDGITWENETLARWFESANVNKKQFHLLGGRRDIPRLTAALDIASSSSAYGEGFSNVIGEAMACGVPCVVTDVGDSAKIVSETGWVVPIKEPEALADAWRQAIKIGRNGRKSMGNAARRRITDKYSLPRIAARYQKLYQDIAINVRNCGNS